MNKKYSNIIVLSVLGIAPLVAATEPLSDATKPTLQAYSSVNDSLSAPAPVENIGNLGQYDTDSVFETDAESSGSITITSVPPEAIKTPMNIVTPGNTAIEQPGSVVTPTVAATGIADILNSGTNYIDWQGMNNRLRSPDKVIDLYAQFAYRPLWSSDGSVTPLAAALIKAVQGAKYHALRPEVYHADAMSSLQAGQAVSEPDKFDILLTDAFVTYKSHLTNGIVAPTSQFSTWNKKPRSVNFASLYEKIQNSGQLGNTFQVKDADYIALQKAYRNELKQSSSAKPLPPIPANSLKPNQSSEAVRVLRQRLGLDTNSNTYDANLRAAVKDYQSQNGLSADGIAGRNTIAHLNRTPKSQLQKLAINMERHRWSYVPRGQYIWVNIPAYKMAVKNGNKTVFESKVIVGRPKRPTPVFSDVLENVVLAPYWNVPKTIFTEDKLPMLQKNPHSLGKNMQVIQIATGKVVNASSVNWKSGGKGYRLRQKPGPRNALGRMKFLFPNRHAIYLHDTPSRNLFKKSRRAFSSGCVRVEKAEDFALFLLDEMGYDRARIKKESRHSREKWVKLQQNKQIPVFLDYYTAWVDSQGKVRYSGDIYGYDKKLKADYRTVLNNL